MANAWTNRRCIWPVGSGPTSELPPNTSLLPGKTAAQSPRLTQGRLIYESHNLGHILGPALDPNHGRQPAQKGLAGLVGPELCIPGQGEEEISRAVGCGTQDRRLHPGVAGVAEEDVCQRLHSLRPANFPEREGQLVPHAKGGVGCHGQELIPDRSGRRRQPPAFL